MMTQPQLHHAVFQELLENHFKQTNTSDLLQKIRIKAWNRFLELGLPSRKSEVFRYVKLHRLFSRQYQLANIPSLTNLDVQNLLYPECSESALVFLNGRFQPALSRLEALPKKAVILPIGEAIKTYGTFLNNQWTKSLKEESDPFAILNTALHQDGAFLYLPPKTVIDTPIQILNIIKGDLTPRLIVPRLHGFAGSQSRLDIYAGHAFLEECDACINMAVEFAVEEDAHVKYCHTSFNLPSSTWVLDAFRASLKRNSSLKYVSATRGSETVRQDYRIDLTGENSEATLNGLWMLGHHHESHHHVLMNHQAPYCRSMQNFKGVLKDEAQSSFEGKILVRREAQKTEAYQLNNNILLSDKAVAQSKPNLEIFADDVKASHGATVGQLDPEQLFYLKTRGFETGKAKNLLVYGFCKEILNLIGLQSLRESITQLAHGYVDRGV